MRRIALAAAAVILTAAAAPAFADSVNGVAAVGTAGVTIVTPISVTQTQALDFGTVTSSVAAGTVNISTAGARAVAGGVGAVAANVGQVGIFSVSGDANAAINVVVGAALTGFGTGITGTTTVGPLPTSLTGSVATFVVGGAVALPASLPAARYTATYTVAVNYP